MAKVRLLERTVAERIAAGEVVERPASIIKELVENSLDAGATRIVVEIKAGGIKALRVTDNGCGMSADDMALAIQRFATSKITDWNDLATLSTLGFRGEALPSIAAVSRMRIKSSLPNQDGGAELYVEGAGVPLIKPCACPPGTRIEVSDLFYNTPARLKFLRSPVAEATNIIDLLGRIAVAHPEVHFRLLSNDKEVFSFPRGMTMPQRLVKLWKIPDDTLIPIAYAKGDMVVDGYVALPFYTRNNRNNQLLLLNGRVIKSSNLSQALQEGFSPMLPRGRFPVGVIRLFLPPDSYDVNVHPSKLEVRFVDTRTIFSLVYGAVAKALEQSQADTVQGRHLSYVRSDAPDRGRTVPLRGAVPPPADGAKTSIDNMPASRPLSAGTLCVPQPVRSRDVEGKNHGLLGILNRIDAVNANLFPISASEKALARERDNEQRSAEMSAPDLEGTLAVSMPQIAMRELAGYALLSNDGSEEQQADASAPKEPSPVFDGAETIGIGKKVFNGVDTLGYAEAQETPPAQKDKQFSGSDTMGFAVIEKPAGREQIGKPSAPKNMMIHEAASKKYVADPLAATVIGLAPINKTRPKPSAEVPADCPPSAAVHSSASALTDNNPAASSPAADPLAATLVESAPASVPSADDAAESAPAESSPAASSPAADPLAAALAESAPASVPSADDSAESAPAESVPSPVFSAVGSAAVGTTAAESAEISMMASPEQERAVGSADAERNSRQEQEAASGSELHQQELLSVHKPVYKTAKSRFQLFGQIHNTFIVGLVDGELWVIDQHTAHERVNYERLGYLSPLQSRSQLLLVPEVMEFSPTASEYLASEPEELADFGFAVEPFGKNTFQLRAVPSALRESGIQSVFRELIEELVSGPVSIKRSLQETMREKLRAMTSCKAAVKAGEALSQADMQKLVEDMLQVEHSRYCPHGRPTRIIMDKRTLERLFHR